MMVEQTAMLATIMLACIGAPWQQSERIFIRLATPSTSR
jgi:hypothetical protein